MSRANAKIVMPIIPARYAGIDTPAIAPAMVIRSSAVPRRSAESTPSPTPVTSQITAAPSATEKLTSMLFWKS